MIRELMYFIITFVIVYSFYVVFVLCRKNILKKFPNSISAIFLIKKYNVVINDKNIKKIANSVYLANSFILALTVSIVCLFKSFFIGLIISIIPLVLMILMFYNIIGKIYCEKGGK